MNKYDRHYTVQNPDSPFYLLPWWKQFLQLLVALGTALILSGTVYVIAEVVKVKA